MKESGGGTHDSRAANARPRASLAFLPCTLEPGRIPNSSLVPCSHQQGLFTFGYRPIATCGKSHNGSRKSRSTARNAHACHATREAAGACLSPPRVPIHFPAHVEADHSLSVHNPTREGHPEHVRHTFFFVLITITPANRTNGGGIPNQHQLQYNGFSAKFLPFAPKFVKAKSSTSCSQQQP